MKIKEDEKPQKDYYKREKPEFKPQKHKNTINKTKNDDNIEIELSLKNNSKDQNINNYPIRHRNTTYIPPNKNLEKLGFNLHKHVSIQENKRKLSKLSKNAFYDNTKMFLTQKQKLYIVNIIKRNYDNNIYLNNTDQSIAFVIPYKYHCPLFMFLLLGIPYIITRFSNRKLIEWRGEPCKFQEAKFYLIIDGYGNYHICNFTKKYFNLHFNNCNQLKGFRTKKNIPTLFSSIDLEDKEEYHEIMYVCNKYYCYKKINSQNYDINSNENNNDNNNDTINSNSGNSANNEKEMYNNHNKDYYFEAPVFLLSNTTNSQIYEIFDNFYLVEDEIQFQLNIYGENKLVIESINFLIILGEKLFSFVTIYTLFVSIFWFYEKYYYCYIIF
jgi:hypothetical protein